ncbi:MAG TPA: hypothetical protein VF655_07850 [Allosphingosinicella sp.]
MGNALRHRDGTDRHGTGSGLPARALAAMTPPLQRAIGRRAMGGVLPGQAPAAMILPPHRTTGRHEMVSVLRGLRLAAMLHRQRPPEP